MSEAFFLVSYDISDDRRRVRVARILEDYGDRVQYSVFEVLLDDRSRFNQMIQRLSGAIDRSCDSVRVYRLCASCLKDVRILGQGEVFTVEDTYLV